MSDHTRNSDHSGRPDYELDEVQELTTPAQFQAIAGAIRPKILGLIGQRAATTKQIAEALNLPKGTAGHHLKVLEAAGLIRVVRTRQVRAITEKYYGRVARLARISSGSSISGEPAASVPSAVTASPLRQALAEFAPAPDPDDPSMFLITHARIPATQARAFARQVEALAQEFGWQAVPGEPVYGLVAGVYRTDWPAIPGDSDDASKPAG